MKKKRRTRNRSDQQLMIWETWARKSELMLGRKQTAKAVFEERQRIMKSIRFKQGDTTQQHTTTEKDMLNPSSRLRNTLTGTAWKLEKRQTERRNNTAN